MILISTFSSSRDIKNLQKESKSRYLQNSACPSELCVSSLGGSKQQILRISDKQIPIA